MFSRPDGFMLYGKLGVDFFTTSELLYPNMKVRIRLTRARPNFYMISDNPNVSLGIVDCSLYNRRITLKDDYHKKRMDMLAYSPIEYNYLETLAKTFIIPARQNQFIQENIFNNAPIRRIAIAVLAAKSQLSMTYFRRMNSKFILQRHWMKTVLSLNFKLIATITLICVKRICL